MKRNTLIKIHLYLSAIFAPIILLMAISGTSYLLGYKGESTLEYVKDMQGIENLTEVSVKSILSDIDPSYSFEYLKESGGKTITRPTTRDYYQFSKNESGIKLEKISPNFLLKIIEAHKGHGPGYFKTVQKIFGISLVLILISGIWLALSVKRDARVTIILMSVGAFITSILVFLL